MSVWVWDLGMCLGFGISVSARVLDFGMCLGFGISVSAIVLDFGMGLGFRQLIYAESEMFRHGTNRFRHPSLL